MFAESCFDRHKAILFDGSMEPYGNELLVNKVQILVKKHLRSEKLTGIFVGIS